MKLGREENKLLQTKFNTMHRVSVNAQAAKGRRKKIILNDKMRQIFYYLIKKRSNKEIKILCAEELRSFQFNNSQFVWNKSGITNYIHVKYSLNTPYNRIETTFTSNTL